MKKALALLLALALLALPGCGGDSPLYGEVVAVEGEYLLLRGEEGDFALRLSEDTQSCRPTIWTAAPRRHLPWGCTWQSTIRSVQVRWRPAAGASGCTSPIW